jgi:hypothetical protein
MAGRHFVHRLPERARASTMAVKPEMSPLRQHGRRWEHATDGRSGGAGASKKTSFVFGRTSVRRDEPPD